jgi:ATPase family associated with various cellular activities (AAA)
MRTSDAIQARVRACAKLRAAWMEHLWALGETSPDQGLAIPPAEVRRILADPRHGKEHYKNFGREENHRELARAAAAAGRALEASSFWKHLGQQFGLTQMERDLLALCVACELDPQLGRVLAYVADDTRATQPSAAAAAALFGWSEGPAPMTALLRWRLARPAHGEPALRATTAWEVDPAVVLSVEAEHWVDPALDRSTRMIPLEQARALPCLYPQLLGRMLAELTPETLLSEGRDLELVLIGPDGAGREILAAQYAAAIGCPLLAVTPALLAGAPPAPSEARIDALVPAIRRAHASGALLFVRDAEQLTPQENAELKALAPRCLRGAQQSSTATHRFVLEPLPTAQRLECWAHWSDAAPPAIVRVQRLTPNEIRLVAQSASKDAIYAALRRAAEAHGELMQPLACPYVWDDLVVSPSLHKMLKDFEAQVLLRWEVYEEWGFARLTHLGQGISALFGGPSGTGKTMAAQVLARSLGLELYRVDLAGVVNKYIGETEKRLRNVFDACERSGALLFFDEADALFGSRMQVKDSHDRFANIEIDYLLQRIEQFDGIAILATNRKNDLDTAFLRRLRFVMDFLPPDKRERRILWEKSLPAFSATGERITDDIDFGVLAEEMDLNGAQIKAIVLGAAFLARSAGKRIGMEQIEVSALREYAKQGQLMRTSLGRGALL